MALYNAVLITGCGGDIGQGLCRILKKEKLADKVIGCDIHEDHAGKLIFDECMLISKANDANYLQSLQDIIEKYAIDLIIPSSEAEINYFLNHGLLESFGNIPLLLVNKEAIEVGLDKLKTVNFLKKHHLAYPWTMKVSDGMPLNIPCILKMCYGQGSKNLVKIEDLEQAHYYQPKRPDDLWQEMLLPENQEYTCGLYRTLSGEIRIIIMRRKLQGGLTGSGEVVENALIHEYLKNIALALNLRGSINVQLRLTDRGPVVFEINSRFSSTIVFRHLLGFEDVVWALYEKNGMDLKPYSPIQPGIKFYRGACEHILFS